MINRPFNDRKKPLPLDSFTPRLPLPWPVRGVPSLYAQRPPRAAQARAPRHPALTRLSALLSRSHTERALTEQIVAVPIPVVTPTDIGQIRVFNVMSFPQAAARELLGKSVLDPLFT